MWQKNIIARKTKENKSQALAKPKDCQNKDFRPSQKIT